MRMRSRSERKVIIPRRALQGFAFGEHGREADVRRLIPRREQKLSADGGHIIVPEKAPALKPNCFAERSRVRVDGSPNENHRHVGRHSTGDFVV